MTICNLPSDAVFRPVLSIIGCRVPSLISGPARAAALLLAASLLPQVASAQCFFSISPPSATFPSSGGNGSVAVTGTAGCAWTSTSSVPWLTISFGQAGSGNGTVGYTVQRNNTPSQRNGNLSIAGQIFTVTQSAGSCAFMLTPDRVSVAANGGSGTFSVVSDCAWTATSNAAWVTISSGSGNGNGSVSWGAAPNTASASRTGTISLGNSVFTLVQAAACVFTATAQTSNFGSTGGTGTITVQGPANCSRTAVSSVPWITLTAGASDEGPGTISFAVAANETRDLRVGVIVINGGTSVTISQQASNCSYSLNPQSVSVPSPGGSGTFSVVSTCSWTATPTVEWIVITSGATGSASGTVAFGVGGNFSASPRSAAIRVGTAAVTITQAGAGCEIVLNANDVTVSSEGGQFTVRVSAGSDCDWSVTKLVDWISLVQPARGSGEGAFEFTVAPNTSVQARSTTITAGNKILHVQQAAASCNVSLGLRTASVAASGGGGSIPIAANCEWRAVPSVGWIRITSATTGTADSNLTYEVSANSAADTRTGQITVNGQAFTITQAGQRCNLSLSAQSADLPARGGSGSVNINGGASCSWSASSSVAWLRVEWSSISGSGSVRFTADANATGSDRAGTVSVAGQTFTVGQAALRLELRPGGILNAASFRTGAVAPGEIVTIFGSGFGPLAMALLELDEGGRTLRTSVGGTAVKFDGVPAPMVYASEGQTSAIVPYSVAGKTIVEVIVEYLGARSNAVTLPVALSSPAIFAANSTGRGPGAVLNQDSSLNTAKTPAARGSIIQIFATGEGRTNPDGVDGRLAATPLPVPVLPVRVAIGGLEARVVYAGGAPGLVAGVVQINAIVPDGVVLGHDVPLILRIGENESQTGITVAVR